MSDLTHVKGLSELQRFLDQLPAKLEQNVMRSALRAGAKVVLDGARQELASNGSMDSGELAAGLRVSTSSRRGTVRASVRPVGKHGYVAKWVEYGTAAHWIKVRPEDRPTRKTRRGLRAVSMRTLNRMVQRGSLVIGGKFVGPQVFHKGARPKPFLRPALDKKAQAALLAVGHAIKKRLVSKHALYAAADVELEAA